MVAWVLRDGDAWARPLRRGDPTGSLDPLLAATKNAQRQDHAAQGRGEPAAHLDAQHPLSGPVDVAQVKQQRRLIEREADSRPEGEGEPLLAARIVAEQCQGAGAESE